jgi:hypothetical protein
VSVFVEAFLGPTVARICLSFNLIIKKLNDCCYIQAFTMWQRSRRRQDFSGYRMDDARVNHALNELKSARERLANLEKDQVALADRLAAARRAQRRIGFYLFGLVVLFSLVMAGAFTLLL